MVIDESTKPAWELEGPVAGDISLLLGNFDLAAHGYVREEWFLSGTAASFRSGDGGAEVAETAAYRTRLVVVRPADPARCSGTAVVEWFNVSGGLDGSPDWAFLHRQLLRTGAVYVGVSAQAVGIEGGGLLVQGTGLRAHDPARYGSLHHPGDQFSFDIFSQAGTAVRDVATGLLGGAQAEVVLGVGESQSAAFLVTYVNEVDPVARVYDGFLVHGRTAAGPGLEGDFLSRMRPADADGSIDISQLEATRRSIPGEPITGARVPVITVQSETDVNMGGLNARCADDDSSRLWEIAGAAHFDTYGLIAAHDDDGSLPPERFAELIRATDQPLGMPTDEPVNCGPQQHYVIEAALAHLERWAGGGAPPPEAPRLETDDDGDLVRDASGIVRGGIRTPWVEVPTAVLSGVGATGGGFGMLFGVTRPFDAATLEARYPAGRDEYVQRFRAAAEQARDAGFLLEDDIDEAIAVAAAAYPS